MNPPGVTRPRFTIPEPQPDRRMVPPMRIVRNAQQHAGCRAEPTRGPTSMPPRLLHISRRLPMLILILGDCHGRLDVRAQACHRMHTVQLQPYPSP